MAEYTGSFETGVNGNTVATSDAGSATAWNDRAFDATHATLEYSNVQKYGTLSCRMVFSATPTTPFVAWTNSTLGGSLTEQWGRIYLWLTNLPSGVHEFARCFDVSTAKVRLRVLSSGVVRITVPESSYDKDGAVSISTGQWTRIEWHVICSTTTGFVEVKLFNDADSETESETITSTSVLNTGTKIDLMRFGELTATNASTTVYMDNILVNDTGYPGPAGELTRIRTPKRLVGPTLVTNSPVTGYTVPANYIIRMRHVHISNPSGSPVDMTLSIGTDAAATRLLDGKPIAADSVYEMACDEVLAAGEIVQMFASSTNVLTITISGEEWVPA